MALSKSKPTNGKKKSAGSGKRRKEGTPEQQDTIKQQPVGKSVNYEYRSRSYLRSQDFFGDFLLGSGAVSLEEMRGIGGFTGLELLEMFISKNGASVNNDKNAASLNKNSSAYEKSPNSRVSNEGRSAPLGLESQRQPCLGELNNYSTRACWI